MAIEMSLFKARVKEYALSLGFELFGIAPALEADGFAHFQKWLEKGFAGTMSYLPQHEEARRNPVSILPDVLCVIMAGINYHSATPKADTETEGFHGRVARYAGGLDYHRVLRDKLNALLQWVHHEIPGCRGRAVVDTAPLLERDFARRAGLGWFGKNTMLIHKKQGSYFLLGALLLDTHLPLDEPFQSSHCGSCTRCLDACPTNAFIGPYQLDARRCISYLTIELRGSIAADLRTPMQDWIFGCDICQEVCPWNHKAPYGKEPALQPDLTGAQLDLLEVMQLSEEEFRRRFRHTALWRTKRSGLLRNAAIALGNIGDESALPVLETASHDSDPIIVEAAMWAIHAIVERLRSRRHINSPDPSNDSF